MVNTIQPGIPRKIIFPTSSDQRATRLLAPPETQCLKSGFVRLQPGESIGFHTTGGSEEIIIPISGEGEVRFQGAEPIKLNAGSMIYNPPELEHDVINTGGELLVYIYIVGKSNNSAG